MISKKIVVTVLGLALSFGAAQSAFAAATDATSTDKAAKQAMKVEWKEETTALKSELQGLRVQQKELTTQIKTLLEANKATRKALSKEEKAVLKQSLGEISKQIKAQHTSIEANRSQKKALFIQVKALKKSGDIEAGVTALEQIIDLKEQIIQAKLAILDLQKNLQNALSAKSV